MLYVARKQRLHKHDPGILQMCQVENYTILQKCIEFYMKYYWRS